MTPIEKQILQSELAGVDRRRAEVEATLASLPPYNPNCPDYRRQELDAEYRELGSMRRDIEEKLHPKDEPKPLSPERKRQIEGVIRQQEQNTRWNIERCEKLGDHRQAKILRLSLLDIPRRVFAEFGEVKAERQR